MKGSNDKKLIKLPLNKLETVHYKGTISSLF